MSLQIQKPTAIKNAAKKKKPQSEEKREVDLLSSTLVIKATTAEISFRVRKNY